ncbi:sugar ABC transporter ATP-binding protein [Synoicihabitans lomoniglobus]|uniref:Sugar ABC transporter ATP-binding protein n=1 Tax=Synoicihabitans lomoniglobus TaxID=2909285 RepID=A0AAF0CMQ2_9BACT|nr:sugar ABC transporter ATP-binding protein [Opitutaceae bacterium LMO-M01]WED63365.1 sugar ABC transporter ATP-binding protein [Opitutaceae bacterium LMO-M01]
MKSVVNKTDTHPTDGPPPLLQLTGIRKAFGATIALGGVDLAIRPGEIHALVGENGAGKSTLMKVLAGIHQPDAGTLTLDRATYAPAGPLDARRAGVAMVTQELAIAPHLSVAANIVLGAEPTRGPLLDAATTRRRATDALTQLGRADIPLDVPAGQLGIAEQQLLEIARALALGCRILVLDEPTSSLTAADTDRLFTLVRRLRDQGTAVVYISHFLEEVKALSDHCTILRDGATVHSAPTANLSTDAIAHHMVGRAVDELYHRSDHPPGEVVLAVSDLRNAPAVLNASFELRRGEVLGLAGLIGAGRSDLLKSIFGLAPVQSGAVKTAAFSGRPQPTQSWRGGLGFLSEDRKDEGLALNLSLAENLTLPRLPWRLSPRQLADETKTWIQRVGVRAAGPDQAIGELSGGNQQKIAFARLLRNDADILLLDEPTRGIDIGAKQTLYRLIDELAESGKAVLLVSSYLPELLGTCDRIAVMCRGTLGPARPTAEWTEHTIMLAATGANAA